ncbi:hypothetical protein [Streptomyces sp. ODS05-4]|uniref:hypothetical protein n=1 Tax=Streptomyces sp. ODS05-4 TaxID=2944939 RepID=UPI00210AE409|nr:hypothetical protein [Streptomyces sp. ODS05-4]
MARTKANPTPHPSPSVPRAAALTPDVPHLLDRAVALATIGLIVDGYAPTPQYDPVDYRKRHTLECGINRLKCHRSVATCYDKLAVRCEATVLVAAVNEWL